MSAEVARIGLPVWIGRFAGHIAGHLHVSAQRQQIELVLGLSLAEADDAFAKADRERLYPHAAQLGYGEVPKLVHQDHDAEDDEKFNDCDHNEREILVLKLQRVNAMRV